MRNFLTVFSFINAILYAVIYSYFDNIIETLGVANLSPVVSNNIKLVALLITGFCAGMLVMLILKLKIKKSFFSFKNLVIVGIFPFICLILSEGTITSFIVTRFFHSSEKVSELLFYLFYRKSIWSLLLVFDIVSSIRFHFTRIIYNHI